MGALQITNEFVDHIRKAQEDDPFLQGKVMDVMERGSIEEIRPSSSYETPGFARSIYPLLEDLYSIFGDLPSLGKALAHVQKMLLDSDGCVALRML